MTQALLHHPLTTHVHMTGGNATHDAVVWGPAGPERQQRMQANTPLLKVRAMPRLSADTDGRLRQLVCWRIYPRLPVSAATCWRRAGQVTPPLPPAPPWMLR